MRKVKMQETAARRPVKDTASTVTRVIVVEGEKGALAAVHVTLSRVRFLEAR